MTRTELMPPGVTCPEETVLVPKDVSMSSGTARQGRWTSLLSTAWRSFLLDFLFLLDSFSPFSSTAWRFSSYLPTGVLGCLCLPCPQLPPVTSPCLHDPCSHLPGAVMSFLFTLMLLFSLICWMSHQPHKELVNPAPLVLEKTSLEYKAEDNTKQWEILGSEERFIASVIDS